MPTQTQTDDRIDDTAYNPGDVHAAEVLAPKVSESEFDQIGAYANDPENASDQISDPKKLKESEEKAGWKTNIPKDGDKSNSKSKFTAKFSGLRSKGPIGFIIVLLISGGIGLSSFSPLMLPIHFKEALFGALDDQVAAMDIRTDHMLKAKLSGMSPGASICTGVKIRCKFTTMTNREIKKFEKAGFTIEPEKSSIPGRNKIKTLSIAGVDGKIIQITDPGELSKLSKTNPEVRSALKKAYNPKFYSWSDSVAKKVFQKFKTDKSSKVSGTTDEERNRSINDNSSGDRPTNGVGGRGSEIKDDADGNGRYVEKDGQKIYEKDQPNQFKELAGDKTFTDNVNTSARGGLSSASQVGVSALKGLSLTGVADSACTVYNMSRAVAAAAKITVAVQLAQYAMIYFNSADKIKAGDMEDDGTMNFIGNKLTATDPNKFIVDESGINGTDSNGNMIATETPNPSFGRNALDSDAFKAFVYNDAPNINSRTAQFAIGGGLLIGTLSKVNDTIAQILNVGQGNIKESRKAIREKCNVVQSFWVRGAGLIAGIVSAVGSVGFTTIASVGASASIGFAAPFIQAVLADIVAGKTVSDKTANTDIGDSVSSGAGVLMGGMAMARGMKPANVSNLKPYLALSSEVNNQNIAMETYEAKDTPFDIYKQYSFAGSLIRKVIPTVVKSSSSMSSAVTSIPSFLSLAFTSLIPQAKASDVFNEERFSKCIDDGYAEVGIDADIMCNPRYIMTPQQLSSETLPVLDYMLSNNQINPDTGVAVAGSDYEKWQKACVDRTAGWGESDDPEKNSDLDLGIACTEDAGANAMGQYDYFGVYHMDASVNSGMEEDETPASTNPTPGSVNFDGAEARRLAGQLAEAPNIAWVNPAGSQEQLRRYAAGEIVNNPCGIPMGVSPYLSSTLLSLTQSKYKITINNIGFDVDRSGVGCEGGTYQHPKGNAVDLNGITILSSGETTNLSSFDANTIKIASQFATDFLAAIPGENGVSIRGGVGQTDCGVSPTLPANNNGLLRLFPDSCNHLHLDVGRAPEMTEMIDPNAR